MDAELLPLDGVRILDLTTVIFGPYATQTLGDLGADVVKVEAPEGDLTRWIGPTRTHKDMGALFLGTNRNKRSIVLDLKRAPAREALWRLVEGADMFVHNIRPQKIAALGFGPAAVLARKPGLVYGGLHGYREGGPYAGKPAYDDVIQGEAGLAGAFLAREGEPQLIPSIAADKSAGLIAANGLLAAFIRRLRTGKGGYVECAMFESLVSYMLVEHLQGGIFDPPIGTPGYARMTSRHRRPHKTRDGYICILPYTDKQWAAFWRVAGQPERMADPRFQDMNARSRHIDALYAAAGEAIAQRDTAEWLRLAAEADIAAGKVNRLEDLPADPQLTGVGFFKPFAHPTEGPLSLPDAPYLFDGASLPVRRAQPRLGEHGAEILTEAGLSAGEAEAALASA